MSPRRRKTLDICESDIMTELAQLRPESDPRRRLFTPEQDRALWYARVEPPDGGPLVPWARFQDWWRSRWGGISESTLRVRLEELKRQGGPA